MSGYGYVSVSIPVGLMVKIDKIVENEILGYKSRSAYIQEAIRNHLSRMRDTSIKSNSTRTKGVPPKASNEPTEKSQQDPASKDIRKKKRSQKAPAEPDNYNLDKFGINA